jgi:hypothetical protein
MLSLTDVYRTLKRIPINEEIFLKYTVQDSTIQLTNIDNFKNLVELLKNGDLFKNEAISLYESKLYETGRDFITIPKNADANKIINTANFVKSSISALASIIPRMLPQEQGDCIYFRFPEAKEVGKITTCLQDIEKASMQLFTLPGIEGVFEITFWENGSLRIGVFVKTAAAVSIIASAAWSAAVVAKKWMELQITYQNVRGLEIKNDSLEDIRNAQKIMLDNLVAAEARNLAKKFFENDCGSEAEKRISYSIQTFSELIRCGGEVNPALNAPEEVSNLFPKYPELFTLQSQVKQLADKK